MNDPREEKLPRWARDKLQILRIKLADAEKAVEQLSLNNGPLEESDTVLDPFAAYPVGLGKKVTVRFWFKRAPNLTSGGSNYIDVWLSSRGLELNGGEQILIRPSAGNSAYIKIVPYGGL